jgi:hypothetical protein
MERLASRTERLTHAGVRGEYAAATTSCILERGAGESPTRCADLVASTKLHAVVAEVEAPAAPASLGTADEASQDESAHKRPLTLALADLLGSEFELSFCPQSPNLVAMDPARFETSEPIKHPSPGRRLSDPARLAPSKPIVSHSRNLSVSAVNSSIRL